MLTQRLRLRRLAPWSRLQLLTKLCKLFRFLKSRGPYFGRNCTCNTFLTSIGYFDSFCRYPLVLKRGRTKMAPPPQEVKRAEEAIERHGSAGSKTYKLIPSAAAVEGAAGMKMELANGDVPLFIADRVAFASSSGPQVRLFEVTHLT
mmetsp:Transcript_22407/g.66424  ORF Transcript_22407/g.66424 Transcript_22407/m.66424 type:complete len:147 (+) Transcript_22407:628-1068(+)